MAGADNKLNMGIMAEITKWLQNVNATQTKSATHMQRIDNLNTRLVDSEMGFLELVRDFAEKIGDPELAMSTTRLMTTRFNNMSEWYEAIQDIYGDAIEMGDNLREMCKTLGEMATEIIRDGE